MDAMQQLQQWLSMMPLFQTLNQISYLKNFSGRKLSALSCSGPQETVAEGEASLRFS
jgi:hypothetical protein